MSDAKILQAILDKVSPLELKVDSGFKAIDRRFEEVNKRFEKVDARLNNLGLQLANLEDDSPTLQNQIVSA